MMCPQRYAKWTLSGFLLALITVLLALFLLNLVNPGFPSLRCHLDTIIEPSVAHKYQGDTVTTFCLIIAGVIVPLLQILVTEWLYNPIVRRGSYCVGSIPETSRWKRTLLYGSRWYRDFFFGLLFTVFVNDIGKTTMSAPRPHFLDTCRPNFTKESCYMGWVHDYECANPNITRFKMIDARKSFPSGHAAISMYGAIFMIIYQHNRINVKRIGTLPLLWLHMIWLGWGFFCALSRVADYRHHPIDITIGGIVGIIGGLFSAIFLCKCFSEKLTIGPLMSGMNGSAGQGGNTNTNTTRIDMNSPGIINNGGIPGGPQQQSNGDIKRPSLRRLLSTQSTLTTMSEISEDRELENV